MDAGGGRRGGGGGREGGRRRGVGGGREEEEEEEEKEREEKERAGGPWSCVKLFMLKKNGKDLRIFYILKGKHWKREKIEAIGQIIISLKCLKGRSVKDPKHSPG